MAKYHENAFAGGTHPTTEATTLPEGNEEKVEEKNSQKLSEFNSNVIFCFYFFFFGHEPPPPLAQWQRVGFDFCPAPSLPGCKKTIKMYSGTGGFLYVYVENRVVFPPSCVLLPSI